jgi:N-acetylglucosamine malate deacetylase 1
MTGPTVLAIMAHPDDAELWAGGTLARHAQIGRAAIFVECASQDRAREAAGGAQILGAQLHMTESLSAEACIELIGRLSADVVICHRWDDPHPDHARNGALVTGAVQKAAIRFQQRMRLYVCDTYESLTLTGNVPGRTIVNVDATFDLKMRALAEHRSQAIEHHFAPMAKRQGQSWGARIGAHWGEAFDPVPVLGMLPAVDHL